MLGFTTKPRGVWDLDPVEEKALEGVADLGRNVIREDEFALDAAAHFRQFIGVNGLTLIIPFHPRVGGVQVKDGMGVVPPRNNRFVVLVVDPDTPEFVLEFLHIPDQVGPLLQGFGCVGVPQPTERVVRQVQVPEEALRGVGWSGIFQPVKPLLLTSKIIPTDGVGTDPLQVFPDVVNVLVLVVQHIADARALGQLQEDLPRPHKRLDIRGVMFWEHAHNFFPQTEFPTHAAEDCQAPRHFFLPLFFFLSFLR